MALYTDLIEIIYKEILISNKYALELGLIKDIYNNNVYRYRKIRLNEVRVYKVVFYKKRRL